MPELPTPKDLLKRVAELHDSMVEFATTPLRELADSLGLPEPPEPPRASDLIENLPDLELPVPGSGSGREERTSVGKSEATKLPSPPSRTDMTVRFRVV